MPWFPATRPPTPTAEKWQRPFVVVTAGGIYVWMGTAHVRKPVKEWSGAAWIEKPVKAWSGATWRTT